MRIAIVGCGYVADFYLATLANHPELELTGVHDRDPARAERFSGFHRLHRYASLADLLGDDRVEMVLNLTNPGSHFEVSWAALAHGKHVYSEKPLATTLPEATRLVEEAERRGLLVASAPCNVLGESAQTLWKALRDGRIGTPRLVYAEIDDGPVPLMDRSSWISASGAPWPSKDEFEVGCTLEHAGYYLGWLTTFFGPARRITAGAAVLMEDKGIPLDVRSPDFSVAVVEFDRGVIARLTCSIYAPHDHRLRIFGDEGVLSTADCWNYGSPVHLQRRTPLGIRFEKYPVLARLAGFGPRRIPLVRKADFRHKVKGSNPMDFCRGVAEVAASVRERRPCRLSARWSLHVNELVLAMQDPGGLGSPRMVTSTFEPMAPMPWADRAAG
ncbi:MAG TPA: Gfo/Idh/MocA family oxidoreductase [Anaeromyxobacteraceae bacterium]|nr:Gfo/Idh/MocA family oxidoreductase [Anaeromyxobacteraceae bacterium]